jgi:hypothetical protein
MIVLGIVTVTAIVVFGGAAAVERFAPEPVDRPTVVLTLLRTWARRPDERPRTYVRRFDGAPDRFEQIPRLQAAWLQHRIHDVKN